MATVLDILLLFAPKSPNVMVEWLSLLLRVREVLSLNLVPETAYSD
jgi:hypothetical protein